MTINAESLRELHHLHKQIKTLKDRLDRGPKQIKAGQVNVTKLEKELEEAKGAVKKAKVNCDGKQLQLKSNESRINDWKGKLNAAKTNKEYQAMSEQIAADEMANSVLSDEILEMFDKISESEAVVKDVEQKLGEIREEVDKVTRRVSDEHAALEGELKQYKDRLTAAEAKLPGSFKADYDRVVRSRGDEALAPLEGESCGGCNVEVTPQMINDVKMNQPVFCKSCGCLLYASEG